MTQVIGVFDGQEQVGAAVEALTAAIIDEENVRVIEPGSGAQATGTVAAPAASPGSGTPQSAAAPVFDDSGLDVDPEQARYLQRQLEGSGVLVVVDVQGKEDTAQVRRILEEQGAQTVMGE